MRFYPTWCGDVRGHDIWRWVVRNRAERCGMVQIDTGGAGLFDVCGQLTQRASDESTHIDDVHGVS